MRRGGEGELGELFPSFRGEMTRDWMLLDVTSKYGPELLTSHCILPPALILNEFIQIEKKPKDTRAGFYLWLFLAICIVGPIPSSNVQLMNHHPIINLCCSVIKRAFEELFVICNNPC